MLITKKRVVVLLVFVSAIKFIMITITFVNYNVSLVFLIN